MMWTYEAERFVGDGPPAVHEALAELVTRLWGPQAILVEDDGVRRTYAITTSVGSDDTDVWLTWEAMPAPGGTQVRVVLEEVDPGPDPADGLTALLDLVAERGGLGAWERSR